MFQVLLVAADLLIVTFMLRWVDKQPPDNFGAGMLFWIVVILLAGANLLAGITWMFW